MLAVAGGRDDRSVPGVVTSLSLDVPDATAADLWLRATWDGHARPDIECPVDAFFGNEMGLNPIGFLTHGQAENGRRYCSFPMPFWSSARIEIENRGNDTAEVTHALELGSADTYLEAECAYFRAAPYYPPTPVTRGHDTVIADVTGRGHIVAATLTGRPFEGRHVSCEGDVRLCIDGIATPQIESDGSESYACYGWGFPHPPQQNPMSGYDGTGEPLMAFSETRVHVGDWIPFRTGFRFCFEAGGHNDTDIIHSGVVLYYGRDEAGMALTDEVGVGNTESEQAHGYKIEGETWVGELETTYEDDVSTVVRDAGRAFTGASRFTVTIDPGNGGVRLRRRSDQQHGRQRARVWVDGVEVKERTWYFADRNPHRRWLEDEFELRPELTRDKSRLNIRIACAGGAAAVPWSEFRYWVFSHVRSG